MKHPSQESLKVALKEWGLVRNLTFIRKVENFVYAIDDEDLILRVTHISHRTQENLQAELGWMDHLMKQNIHFSHPVKNIQGQLIHSFVDDDESYFAVVFKKAPGKQLLNKEDFTERTVKNWGTVLGQLHQATKNAPSFKRPDWEDDSGFTIAKSAIPNDSTIISNIFVDQISWLQALPKNKDCFGLVHADVHNGNFHVSEDGTITLFDFDDCHYQWFAYDIAVPIYSLLYTSEINKVHLDINRLYRLFIEGYLTANNLDDEWIQRVPDFVKYRSALLFLWTKANLENNKIEVEHHDKVKKLMEWSVKIANRKRLFIV